jgi:hypothetical protein
MLFQGGPRKIQDCGPDSGRQAVLVSGSSGSCVPDPLTTGPVQPRRTRFRCCCSLDEQIRSQFLLVSSHMQPFRSHFQADSRQPSDQLGTRKPDEPDFFHSSVPGSAYSGLILSCSGRKAQRLRTRASAIIGPMTFKPRIPRRGEICPSTSLRSTGKGRRLTSPTRITTGTTTGPSTLG